MYPSPRDKESKNRLASARCHSQPLRCYHHCDKLGMLVWQDMPNGSDHSPQFEKELKGMIDAARHQPDTGPPVVCRRPWTNPHERQPTFRTSAFEVNVGLNQRVSEVRIAEITRAAPFRSTQGGGSSRRLPLAHAAYRISSRHVCPVVRRDHHAGG